MVDATRDRVACELDELHQDHEQRNRHNHDVGLER